MDLVGVLGALLLFAALFLAVFALRAAVFALDVFRPSLHKRAWPLKPTRVIDNLQHGVLLSKPVNHLATRGGFFDSHIALAAIVSKANQVKTDTTEVKSILDNRDENLTPWLPEFFVIPPKRRSVKILEDLNRRHEGLRRYNLDSLLNKASESTFKTRGALHDDFTRDLQTTNALVAFLRNEYLLFMISSNANIRYQVLECMNTIRDALESFMFYVHIFGEPFVSDEHSAAQTIHNQHQKLRDLLTTYVKELHDRGSHDGSYLSTLVVDLFQGDRGITLDEIVDHVIHVLLSTFDSSVALCAWTLRHLNEDSASTAVLQAKAAGRLFESRPFIRETMRLMGIGAYTARFQVVPVFLGKNLRGNTVLDLWSLVAASESIANYNPHQPDRNRAVELHVLAHSDSASISVAIASLLLSLTLKHYNISSVAPVRSSSSSVDLGIIAVPKDRS